MQDNRFDTPVTVRSPKSSDNQLLRGPQEASGFLLNNWPGKRSPKHRAALQACHDALSGDKPVMSARRALVAAAREADILVREAGAD
ncbi:MAG TPA: DUF982 domain-containing protein [Mesorhizobium sp.]|jgi:hypothetical protein|nr:DUF982 domain-containing protein [Mesorhizobium sp.]